MRLNPLHSIEWLTHRMHVTGEYPDVVRGTGRSTAQALEYIAKAIQNPYVTVHVRDHAATLEATRVLCRAIEVMCCSLGLLHMRVNISNQTLTFGNPHGNSNP